MLYTYICIKKPVGGVGNKETCATVAPGGTAINCCDEYGQCRQGLGCPVRESPLMDALELSGKRCDLLLF